MLKLQLLLLLPMVLPLPLPLLLLQPLLLPPLLPPQPPPPQLLVAAAIALFICVTEYGQMNRETSCAGKASASRPTPAKDLRVALWSGGSTSPVGGTCTPQQQQQQQNSSSNCKSHREAAAGSGE